MRRDQFMESKQLQVKLINVEKMLMHRNRYVVEVVTDRRVEQVKKLYKEFENFHRLVQDKLKIKEIMFQKAYWVSDRFKNLEAFFHKINSGYLYYHSRNPHAHELRSYLFIFLFTNDGLDTLDDNSDEEGQRNHNSPKNQGQEEEKRRLNGQIPGQQKTSLAATLKNIYRSRRKSSGENLENDSLKLILRQVNRCWLKCPNSFKKRDKNSQFFPFRWQEYDLHFGQCWIIFRNRSDEKILPICNMKIQLSFEGYTKLVFYNEVDQEKFEVRLTNKQHGNEDVYEKYLALYTHGKEISRRFQDIKILNKIRMRISLKRNLKEHTEKKSVKELNCRILHGPLVLMFTLPFEHFVDLYIPIFDQYDSLELSINEIREGGLLPTLMQSSHTFNLNLPVTSIYDYIYNNGRIHTKQSDIKIKHFDLRWTKSTLCLDYKAIGNFKSMCFYQEKDIYQGEEEPLQPTRDELRMHNNRLKRIIWSVQKYTNFFTDLRNYTFPWLSTFMYLLSIFLVFLWDNNYLIHGILTLILTILVWNNPRFRVFIFQSVEILQMDGWLEKVKNKMCEMNPYLPANIRIKREVQKEQFLQNFLLTRRNKGSIYKKFKRLKFLLLKAQNVLLILVSLLEKIKNLFIWYYYQKTKLFFLLTIAILIGLFFLPIRLILFFIIIRQARKGYNYHKRTQQLNRIIMYEILRIVIEENNFKTMRTYLQSQGDTIDKKNEFNNFSKKCKEIFENVLEIVYPHEEIFSKIKNMKELIIVMSTCKHQYILPIQFCNKHSFNSEWSVKKSLGSEVRSLVYGFLLTIPSDKHIFGVKTINDDDDEEEDEGIGIDWDE